MPNKTIYVRDEDLPVWEALREHTADTGETISAMFAEFLRSKRIVSRVELKVRMTLMDGGCQCDIYDGTASGSWGQHGKDPELAVMGAFSAFWQSDDGVAFKRAVGSR